MYKSEELLNAVKAKYELNSDYKLAKKLDLSPQAISKIVNNKSFLSTSNAYRVAELLYLHPLKVIASCEFERAERLNDETMKNFWTRIWEENSQ